MTSYVKQEVWCIIKIGGIQYKVMRRFLADALLVAFGAVLVYIFGLLLIVGRYVADEPNTLKLWFEFAGSVGILVFAVFNIVKDAKNRKY